MKTEQTPSDYLNLINDAIIQEKYNEAIGKSKEGISLFPRNTQLLCKLFDLYLKSSKNVNAYRLAKQMTSIVYQMHPSAIQSCL